MNFLENIFHRLSQAPDYPVIQEARDGRIVPATGVELLASIQRARSFLNKAGLRKGDRCALLAPNSIRWVSLDLAILAEGGIVAPLYARQSAPELVGMMKDCAPSVLCCGDETLRGAILECWPDAPPSFLLDEVFSEEAGDCRASNYIPSGQSKAIPSPSVSDAPQPLAASDPVTIIYTSGTSGEPKGVILCAGNIDFMLRCTIERLDVLMGPTKRQERVFHYLPFCFCASWIALLTCLSRHSLLTISTDFSKLSEEMKLAAPDYFLNVPALLERMRAGIEGQFKWWGGSRQFLFDKGKEAWLRRRTGTTALFDLFWLAVARGLIYPAIKKKIAPNLKALICGSAPLSLETQLFFLMIGIPVLQVYGLTETTGICTMDHPARAQPGWVGSAIDGIEMKLGPGDEILVRGPNLFQGYWNRPEATRDAMDGGWFHTGDQGEVNGSGNWRITGRIKNLIVLSSGHNVAPEPIEDMLLREIRSAQQVLVVGNGRSFLSAIVTGDVNRADVEQRLAEINPQLPHYRRVRAFYLHKEPFTVDNGLLTVNGKLKREIIAERLREQIEELYRHKAQMVQRDVQPQ